MKNCLVLVLFFVMSIYSINSFACDACNKSTVKTSFVASKFYSGDISTTSNSVIDDIRCGKKGEFLFPNFTLPAKFFHNASLNDVHRCGQVSARVIMDCKCGKPWHTWIPASKAQFNCSAEQKTKAAQWQKWQNSQVEAKNSTINNLKTAVQNYKQ